MDEWSKESQLDKFNKALGILYLTMFESEIVDLINKNLPPKEGEDKFIHPSYFNRLKNGQFKENNLKTIAAINTFFEEYIENIYKKIWNSGNYSEQPAFVKKSDLERLNALIGVWLAYSWDKHTTDITEIGHIHFFKIEFESLSKIKIGTRNTHIDKSRIILINDEKLLVEFFDERRNITCIIEIGSGKYEDLKRFTLFPMSYVDSGNRHIKCGLALLERTSLKYDDIIPTTKPFSELAKEKGNKNVEILKDAQLVIK